MLWWKPLLPYIPSIIDSAAKLYETIRKSVSKTGAKSREVNVAALESDLAKRVASLEQNEIEQAKLVQNMAEQLSNMTTAINVLSKRILIALALSIAAVAIALWALLRN